MTRKTGTFQEFKDYTVAVARGERKVDPSEPKVWVERIEGESAGEGVQFASLEAGAKLLSAKNRALLRTIAERQPKSVTELAAMTGRAEQNVLRTLSPLSPFWMEVFLPQLKLALHSSKSTRAMRAIRCLCIIMDVQRYIKYAVCQ